MILIISRDDFKTGKSSHRIIGSWDDLTPSHEMMKCDHAGDDNWSPHVTIYYHLRIFNNIIITCDDFTPSREMISRILSWDDAMTALEVKIHRLKRSQGIISARGCWKTVLRNDMFASRGAITSIVVWDDIISSHEIVWNRFKRHITFSSQVIISSHLTRSCFSTFHEAFKNHLVRWKPIASRDCKSSSQELLNHRLTTGYIYISLDDDVNRYLRWYITISRDDPESSCDTYNFFISSDNIISSHEMIIVNVSWDVLI